MKSQKYGHKKEEQLEAACPRCGMLKSEWPERAPEGHAKAGKVYCCAGCAEDTGCTCESGESEYYMEDTTPPTQDLQDL